MNLEEQIAVMAAPIYAQIRKRASNDAEREEAMMLAIKEAKAMWRLINENPSIYEPVIIAG
jgi:hypothetical protein